MLNARALLSFPTMDHQYEKKTRTFSLFCHFGMCIFTTDCGFNENYSNFHGIPQRQSQKRVHKNVSKHTVTQSVSAAVFAIVEQGIRNHHFHSTWKPNSLIRCANGNRDAKKRKRNREREIKAANIMNRKFTQLQSEAEFCQLTHWWMDSYMNRSKWVIPTVNKAVVGFCIESTSNCPLCSIGWRTYCGSYTRFLEVFVFHSDFMPNDIDSTAIIKDVVAIVPMLLCCVGVWMCVCRNNVHCSMRSGHCSLSNNWKIGYFGICTRSFTPLRWWSICACQSDSIHFDRTLSLTSCLSLFSSSISMHLHLSFETLFFFSLSIFLPSSAACDSSVAIRMGRVCGKCMLLKQQPTEKKNYHHWISHTQAHTQPSKAMRMWVCVFYYCSPYKMKVNQTTVFVCLAWPLGFLCLSLRVLSRSRNSFVFFLRSFNNTLIDLNEKHFY